MKKFELWTNDEVERSLLVPVEDIQKIVDLSQDRYYGLRNLNMTDKKIDSLCKKLNGLMTDDVEIGDADDLQEWIDLQGVKAEAFEFGDFVETKNTIVYNKQFYNGNNFEEESMYEWWDGHNHVKEFVFPCNSATEITISDSNYSLDEWDGRNHKSGSDFYHEDVHKIIEIDGKKPNEPMYLIYGYSQYQGSHTTGIIMTREEVIAHIEEISDNDGYKRNIDEYMENIDAIEIN